MTMNQETFLAPSQTAAGWFPDDAPGVLRYWDGTQWTGQIAAPQVVPVAQPATNLSTTGKVAVAAAVAAFIGSFMPWVSVMTIFGSIEASGFDGEDGKVTAVAAIVSALAGYVGLTKGKRGLLVLAILAALGGAITSIYDVVNVQNVASGDEAEGFVVSVGYGLYLCVAGFVICFLALLKARRERAVSAIG